MEQEQLQRELAKAKVFCLRKLFKEAVQIYEAILLDEFDNAEANIGLLRAHSENFTKYDGEQIESDINVIESLFPSIPDQECAQYIQRKKAGRSSVAAPSFGGNTASAPTSAGPVSPLQADVDKYLSFVPIEIMDFFPWEKDFNEFKLKMAAKLDYDIKNHTDNDCRVSCKGNLEIYKSKGHDAFNFAYPGSTSYRFINDIAEFFIAIWLKDFLDGHNTYYFLNWVLTDSTPRHQAGAYNTALKNYDENRYYFLCYKFSHACKVDYAKRYTNGNSWEGIAEDWRRKIDFDLLAKTKMYLFKPDPNFDVSRYRLKMQEFMQKVAADSGVLIFYPWYSSLADMQAKITERLSYYIKMTNDYDLAEETTFAELLLHPARYYHHNLKGTNQTAVTSQYVVAENLSFTSESPYISYFTQQYGERAYYEMLIEAIEGSLKYYKHADRNLFEIAKRRMKDLEHIAKSAARR